MMMRFRLSALPREAMVQVRTGWLSKAWTNWFREVASRVDATAFRMQALALKSQSAAIPTTSIPLGTIAAGLYRVTYALRLTRAATTSSSLRVTLGWMDDWVTCSRPGQILSSNVVTEVVSETVLLRCDKESVITYAVSYASVGATSAQYQLDIVVEAVPEVFG